jgi:hypothetical protein
MDCDLAATWRLLQMGGAYRNKKILVVICAMKEGIDWVGGHHGMKCEEWCLKVHPLDEGWECCHQRMLHEVNIVEMNE